MDTYTETIVVPYDFTDKADSAVRHAAIIAKNMNAEVVLLHIVKKEDMSAEAEEKLAGISQKFKEDLGVGVTHTTREGTIFKTINEVVAELNSAIVVMGTHGMKGMQKITGSWALKVIVGCHVPYLIVQKDPCYGEPSKILFPVNAQPESKEKLKWVSMLRYLTKIKVILFAQIGGGPFDSAVKANMVFCRNYLENRDIETEDVYVKSGGLFYDLSLNYARENNVDMVMITTTRDLSFHNYILGTYEQTFIANEAGIPVLVVNPQFEVKLGYSNF